MALTRRTFLSLLGGSAAGAVLFQACGVPEDELLVQAPLEMPEDLVAGFDNHYATLCRECPTSEGVTVRVMAGRAKKIEGNVDYPINRGKHSARCEAALQALYHPDRISAPLVRSGARGADEWNEITWDDAIGRLAGQMTGAPEPSSVVMVTEPLGSHVGMVVNRFVTAIGGRHVPYETLEQTNLRTAIRNVYGQDVLPDFDIGNSRYVLSFGADFLNTWLSPVRYGTGYGEFRQGDRERGTLVHVDSRFSMTGANADEWVFVKPGWEGHLALSIAQVIISEGLGDADAAEALTDGGAIDLVGYAPEAVSGLVGVDAERIRHIAREFAGQRPSLAIGGGSAAAHTNGLFNLTAIYALNFLVGSVGREGGVVLNPAPALDDVPVTPTTATFGEWAQLASGMSSGQVSVLMVRGADPVYGLPDAVGIKSALLGNEGEANVPYIVSFSSIMDDTTAMADLVLPEHHSLEDWGDDVPNPGPGYQTVGFQQPVVRPFFDSRGAQLGTRNFPDVLRSIAGELGLDLKLAGQSFKDVLENGAMQLFDTRRGSVRAGDFRSFWNGVLQRGGWWDTSAGFDGPGPAVKALPANPIAPNFGSASGSYRFSLLPFASASLTDGRGAYLPWLQATPDPISTATWRTWVELSMKVAEEMDIKEGDVVRVTSSTGSIEALAYPHPGMPPDVVSIPIGQGHAAGGRYAEKRGANVLSILLPLTDGETGALAWASTRVNIEKTDEWERLPKFENVAPDLAEDDDGHIIQITPTDN
jgi:anaerobic selenocysteine-containing dehydrogenase